eukprot:g8745.t1
MLFSFLKRDGHPGLILIRQVIQYYSALFGITGAVCYNEQLDCLQGNRCVLLSPAVLITLQKMNFMNNENNTRQFPDEVKKMYCHGKLSFEWQLYELKRSCSHYGFG